MVTVCRFFFITTQIKWFNALSLKLFCSINQTLNITWTNCLLSLFFLFLYNSYSLGTWIALRHWFQPARNDNKYANWLCFFWTIKHLLIITYEIESHSRAIHLNEISAMIPRYKLLSKNAISKKNNRFCYNKNVDSFGLLYSIVQ